MRFLKKVSNFFAICATLTAITLCTPSCTPIDYELGDNFVPNNDLMGIGIDTIRTIKSYQIAIDSTATDVWTYPMLGSIMQPFDGLTTCSFVGQYIPGAFESDSLWGDHPTIDSVIMVISIKSMLGAQNTPFNIDIYDLKKPLPYHKDSSYYSNFPVSEYIETKPIVEIQTNSSVSSIRTNLPVDFAKQLLDTTGRVYFVDTLFQKKFYGMHFKTNKVLTGGAMMELDLENTYFTVHYHNKNTPTPDTTYTHFYLNNATEMSNESFTLIDHNYSFADPIIGIKPSSIDDKKVSSNIFVTSMGGLAGKLEIPKEEIERIKALVKSKGYSQVAINNATIIFSLANTTISAMNFATSQIAFYYNVNTLKMMPDYFPPSSDTDYTPSFDGKINRALGLYQMNITSYIQKLFSGQSEIYTIDMAPAYGVEDGLNGVHLYGYDSVEPIRLGITYTMVK